MTLAWRLARRDLRGGFAGLRLLFLCLLLGVAAIAGVGSLSSAILAELSGRGQVILGGDVELETVQRRADPAERAAFARAGRVSETLKMRAMVATPGGEAILSELKGVDDAYPLYGAFRLAPGAVAPRPRGNQVAVAPALAERLGLRVGDQLTIGEARLTVIGVIAEEPDRVGEGFTLGPVALVDLTGLAATGLVQPGSLYDASYRIRLPQSADPAAVAQSLQRAFPSAGWEARDRSNGAPGTRRFIERLGQFLALVGLAALVVAGIGVGNGVGAWLDSKRDGIATLKTLGASSATIARMHALQIALVGGAGVIAGLAIGAAVPTVVTALAGSALPVPPRLGLYPAPLALGAAFGVLIAAAFALAPLARARAVPAAALFRGGIEPAGRPPWRVLLAIGGVAAAIGALAILTATDRLFASGFVVLVVAVLAVLAVLGQVIRRGAARLPRPRRPLLRLALANLHRPGAQTDRLVVALGLGLTLFVALAVIQTNLSGQIERTVPQRAPSFFALDIPVTEIDRFRALVRDRAPGAELATVPSLLRGPVVAVDGVRVADMETIPEDAWILRGDRGLTYAADVPAGSRVVAGRWWPADYAGPPLVSLDAEAARALGIGVGDTITVAVLGVDIEATIASLREINWDTLGFNFVLIFSPGVLEGAPHSFMATIALPEAREAALSRAVTAGFPAVSMIRVKDLITQVGDLLRQLSAAVAAAASVAVAAGIAVLVGAVAASRRARTYDSVLLKLLGATRGQVLLSQALEYALLAALLAGLALALGGVAGWYVVTQVFELDWAPDWPTVLAVLLAGAVTTLGIGLLGALPALAARPARALRTL